MRWYKNSVEEIRSDKALMLYGIALSLSHLLTIYFWFPRTQINLNGPICWPYFQNCAGLVRFIEPHSTLLFIVFCVLSCTALIGFIGRNAVLGYWGLVGATAFKFLMLSLSYRFMGNYHYMSFLVILVFLFWPAKKITISFLIVGFYVSAATLKFNTEWLSGASLLAPLPYGEPWKSWSLLAVLPLELFISSFFLFRNPWLFWVGSVCFLAFHLISWFVVGYFYPLTMFLLLSIYILNRLLNPPVGYVQLLRQSPHKAAVLATLGLFILAQMVPYVKGGDGALTGEGRAFALNMLDATSECQNFTVARFQSFSQVGQLKIPRLGTRIRCDPVVYHSVLMQQCQERMKDPAFLDMDFALLARRSTSANWSQIVTEKDVCRTPLKLSMWPINDWITDQPRRSVPSHVNPWPSPVSFQEITMRNQHSPMTSAFRGDVDRTGLIKNFDAKIIGKNWKEVFRVPNGNVGIHSAAKATPAVDETGIYIGGDSGWFFAYSWDGQLKWKVNFEKTGRGIHSTSVLDEHSVYVATYDGRVYKLEKATGVLQWMIDMGDAVGASSVLWEKSLIVNIETNQPNGYVARVDRKTGEVEWVSSWLRAQSHSSPTLAIHQGLVLIGDNASFTRAFDLGHGGKLWETPMGGQVKSTISVHNGAAFVTGWNKKTMALDIATGRVLWSFDMNTGTRSSPTVWAKHGLVLSTDSSGHLYALEIPNGKLRWQRAPETPNSTPSSPVVIGDQLGLYVCGLAELCFFSPAGRVLQKVKARHKITATPVIHDQYLIISEDHPGDLVVYVASANP